MAADLEVYRVVNEHFRQDVREFWPRSNFYLLVQAALISVFVSNAQQIPHSDIPPVLQLFIPRPEIQENPQRNLSLILGILGLMHAIIWLIVSRGAIIWIRRWRAHMIAIDNVVDRHQIYSRVESYAQERPVMSPSTVSHLLPIIFIFGWFALLLEFIFGRGA
jgi:hypothetical protein